jgi:hypothetical protein
MNRCVPMSNVATGRAALSFPGAPSLTAWIQPRRKRVLTGRQLCDRATQRTMAQKLGRIAQDVGVARRLD